MLRRLRTAVYMVFLPSDQCEAPDTQIAPCVEAERALDRYAACRDVGDEDSLVLEHILTLQDDYFTTLQRYRLSELWQHVSAFATSDVPLPVAAVLGKLRVGGRLNAAA